MNTWCTMVSALLLAGKYQLINYHKFSDRLRIVTVFCFRFTSSSVWHLGDIFFNFAIVELFANSLLIGFV